MVLFWTAQPSPACGNAHLYTWRETGERTWKKCVYIYIKNKNKRVFSSDGRRTWKTRSSAVKPVCSSCTWHISAVRRWCAGNAKKMFSRLLQKLSSKWRDGWQPVRVEVCPWHSFPARALARRRNINLYTFSRRSRFARFSNLGDEFGLRRHAHVAWVGFVFGREPIVCYIGAWIAHDLITWYKTSSSLLCYLPAVVVQWLCITFCLHVKELQVVEFDL